MLGLKMVNILKYLMIPTKCEKVHTYEILLILVCLNYLKIRMITIHICFKRNKYSEEQ